MDATAVMAFWWMVTGLGAAAVAAASVGSVPCQRNCSSTDPLVRRGLTVPVGSSINIFHEYGFLSLSIHVAPIQNNVTEPHQLFRALTQSVLDNQFYRLNIKRNSRSQPYPLQSACNLSIGHGARDTSLTETGTKPL